MTRKIHKLSAKAVAALKKPGRHSDGANLFLHISEHGGHCRKSWVFRYVRGSKTTELGLGPIANVSLAQAREKASELRRQLADGRDILADRRAAKRALDGRRTFGQVATALMEAKRPEWRSAIHASQWRQSLEAYAAPLWDRPNDEIERQDVLEVLKPLWSRAKETGSRTRARIEAVFDAAKAQGLRSGENPAAWRGNLSHDLPRRKKDEITHHPALAYEAIPEFFQKLRARESISALALEFCVLTAARSGEVRGAAWQEIDLDGRIWTVPASRMKGKREHRVPLSDPALAVLRHVEPLRTTGGPVFPGRRTGKPLAQAALRQALEAAGIAGKSVHGMRSAFRDWCGDATDFPREVAEGCLAHAVRNEVELAYRRSSALEKRRGLMEAWAAFCEPKEGSNVIAMTRRI